MMRLLTLAFALYPSCISRPAPVMPPRASLRTFQPIAFHQATDTYAGKALALRLEIHLRVCRRSPVPICAERSVSGGPDGSGCHNKCEGTACAGSTPPHRRPDMSPHRARPECLTADSPHLP